MQIERIAILGAGAWGTALAIAAADVRLAVTLVARNTDQAAEINSAHTNRRYLPGITLPQKITATCDLECLNGADLVMTAVPAQITRARLQSLSPEALRGKPVILTAKGLEALSGKRQSEILAELHPEAEALVLSGPSFASDMAIGRPTAVTLAGQEETQTNRIAQALASKRFRPYASADIVGVELAGALKNVYALACGAVDGAELGASARAALIARGFAEMTRLVEGLGGAPATMAGLAGLGDLTLSCTTPQSRNYSSGVWLGRGETPAEIERRGTGLSEGIASAPVALALAQRHGIDAPLIAAVNQLIAGTAPIADIVTALMTRPLKKED